MECGIYGVLGTSVVSRVEDRHIAASETARDLSTAGQTAPVQGLRNNPATHMNARVRMAK